MPSLRLSPTATILAEITITFTPGPRDSAFFRPADLFYLAQEPTLADHGRLTAAEPRATVNLPNPSAAQAYQI